MLYKPLIAWLVVIQDCKSRELLEILRKNGVFEFLLATWKMIITNQPQMNTDKHGFLKNFPLVLQFLFAYGGFVQSLLFNDSACMQTSCTAYKAIEAIYTKNTK